jgi:hypothetical protein
MVEFSRPRKRRKRAAAPVVSAQPIQVPGPGRYAGRAAVEPTRGRVLAVFGPPGAGTSTILRCLAESAKTPIAVVSPDFGDLEEQVRAAAGASVVFVDGFPHTGFSDGDGKPAGPRAVQYLFDRRLIFPGSGAIVRVTIDPELLVRSRRATEEGIKTWFRGLPHVEEAIRGLSLPYFNIHNEPGEDGLFQAVQDLAGRAGIREK